MSTDRELLELAAKAAGLETHRYCEPWKAMAQYTVSDGFYGPSWNPLADDGDALRLATKLKMHVETYSFGLDTGPCVNVCTWADRMLGYTRTVAERVSDDDYLVATRRAIVRAAAEVGKAMP